MHTALIRKCFAQAMVFAGTSALALSLTAGSAFAQNQDDTIEEIKVTGSRIARDPNLGASVAVQSVGAEDIQLSGRMDVVEVVREIPALMTSETGDGSSSPVGSAFDSDDSSVLDLSGEAVLQLRGMGLSRTLVLVDGRRHVAGSPGNAAVDINTIPQPLIERVEVLTGGASAIYGADAVTGVVNFIMKDRFEGLDVTAQGGMSSEGDGEDFRLGVVWGTNFANDRGNFAIAVDYRDRSSLIQGDRPWSANNAIRANEGGNPALRFQKGEITADMTNFTAFYDLANSQYPHGLLIPTADDFVSYFNTVFPGAPITTGDLTSGELALIDRAANSPLELIDESLTFSISSEGGVLVPGTFVAEGIDLDNNGTDDCFDTFTGYNSVFDHSDFPPGNPFLPAFGALGGCWHVDQGGVVRVYDEGRIIGDFNQFGGDGVHANGYSPYSLTPDDQRTNIVLMASFDVTNDMTVFAEFKYVDQETELFDSADGFYDLLRVLPDNPFIPAQMAPFAVQTDGFYITRDPNDLGDAGRLIERELTRFVLGLEGEFDNGWGYEVSLNHGQTNLTDNNKGTTIMDRYFAAIDVVMGPNGPTCRSEIDGSLYPTTEFGIPTFDAGFFTFRPGQGHCQPYNIFNGPDSESPAAIDWFTRTVVHESKVEQTVLSVIVDGDTGFGFDAGNVAFAAGAEVRAEESQTIFHPLINGVCPFNTPDCVKGELVRDNPNVGQTSLVWDPRFVSDNSGGDYSVWDVFGEVDVPLVAGASFAEELTFNAAARFSQYSNVGDTFTWQAGFTWTPIEDIRFRTTLSRAVRAPNIAELFNPVLAATFRPRDPCTQTRIDSLLADPENAAVGAVREANCRADGIPVGFVDPLSARVSGATSGNPDLTEEEADTLTFGFVFTPTFLEGLTLSVDYWDIEITDAIDFVAAQDIVDNCYDSPTFPNDFCTQFRRVRDPASAQFLGFDFIQQTQLNFGTIESSGIDFQAAYAFELAANAFTIGVQGTKVNEIDEFFDPGDPTAVDPELGELRRPELSYTAFLNWGLGPVYAQWTSLYQDAQALQRVEIETASFEFGPAGFSDDFWAHNLSASWDATDNLRVFGGVNNVSDEKPFVTETAYPVGPHGRYFFLGVNWSM